MDTSHLEHGPNGLLILGSLAPHRSLSELPKKITNLNLLFTYLQLFWAPCCLQDSSWWVDKPSNALYHLASTYLTLLEGLLIALSRHFEHKDLGGWGKYSPSLCQFPNEFLVWLSKLPKISLPLASTPTLISHLLLWTISFSEIHLSLQVCPCVHLQIWDGQFSLLVCELLKGKDYSCLAKSDA